jgi:hypothetical protein
VTLPRRDSLGNVARSVRPVSPSLSPRIGARRSGSPLSFSPRLSSSGAYPSGAVPPASPGGGPTALSVLMLSQSLGELNDSARADQRLAQDRLASLRALEEAAQAEARAKKELGLRVERLAQEQERKLADAERARSEAIQRHAEEQAALQSELVKRDAHTAALAARAEREKEQLESRLALERSTLAGKLQIAEQKIRLESALREQAEARAHAGETAVAAAESRARAETEARALAQLALEECRAQLNRANASLVQADSEAKREADRLKLRATEAERRAVDVNQRLDASLSREALLGTQVASLEAALAEAHRERDEERARAEARARDARDREVDCGVLREERAGLRAEIDELSQSLRAAQQEGDRLRKAAHASELDKEEALRGRRDAEARALAAEAEAGRARAHAQEMAGTVASLHELTALQRDEIASKSNEVQQAFYREAEQAAKIAEVESVVQQQRLAHQQRERDVKSLRKEVKDRLTELDQERELRKKADEGFKVMSAEVATLTSARNALARKLKERETELAEARTIFETKDHEISDLRSRTASTSSKLRDAQRARDAKLEREHHGRVEAENRERERERELAFAQAQAERERERADRAQKELERLRRAAHAHSSEQSLYQVSTAASADAAAGETTTSVTTTTITAIHDDRDYDRLERHHRVLQDKYDKLIETITPLLNEVEEVIPM